jgi:single-stranded-DNA-specific exonuclease
MIKTEKKYHLFKGVPVFQKALESLDNAIVYFDPDVDGMVSGYLICRKLSLDGKSFQWYVNKDRMHDWSLPLEACKGKTIIAVDFKVDKAIVKKLVDLGCTILSIDHHVNEPELIYYKSSKSVGIVINNQYPFEEEDCRYLSGAGVVFETLCSIDSRMDTEENRALVGLTLLSDVCDIENPLAASYLSSLYNHKNKGYIGYLISHTIGSKDFGFGSPRMDRNYVDFKFSPAINSNLRFGNQDSVVEFFLGSGDLDLSCHERQKQLVKDIQAGVTVRDFSALRVVYFEDSSIECAEDESILSSFVGLVASRYLDGKHSVLCYDIAKDSTGKKYVKRASFRGNINTVDYLSGWKKFVNAEGHPTAFGVKGLIPSKALFSSLNDVCESLDSNSVRRVDIRPVINMSIFNNSSAKAMAEANMYCLARNRKYVRYVGKGVAVKREGASYREYSVDGVSVMCFDLSLSFDTGLIFPILERGFIKFYLQPDMG